jgi:DNA primase
MAHYSDELLEEVRSRNDIVDIISQYVTLKRKGRNFFGLCPFHNEKSPSFSVSPDKQIFKCFGCGKGGNVFHFLMNAENISFVEAVQILAERANIELPKNSGDEDEKQVQLKNEVYKVNEAAAMFYHETLYKPTSKVAQEYVKKRKLGNNTLKAFLIGYAPMNNELFNHLKSKGFSVEAMLASNLIGRSEKGIFYDKFKHRLMIPIQDVRNRYIAFGGRVLDDSKPKYINSPEDIVYSKGRNLFGLNVAKRNSNGMLKKILIVEGYMDAISLYQRGITNVVASLGTALTDAQGRLLRRNAEQVILGYDADGAGQTAILRGMDILKNLGVDIRVLQISDAKDPDEYVIKYGADKFKKCMEDAISVVEFKVKILKQTLDLNNTNDKIKFLNEIAKTLASVDNSMEREVYIDKIGKTYGISTEAIQSEINKLTNKEPDKKKIENTSVIIKKNEEKTIDENVLRREKMLIYLLVNNSDQTFKRLSNVVKPEYIQDTANKEIIAKIFEKLRDGQNTEDVLNWFEDQEMVSYLAGVLANDFEITDVDKAIEDVEKTYLKEAKILRRDEIIEILKSPDLDKDEKANLEKELNNIIIDLVRMK